MSVIGGIVGYILAMATVQNNVLPLPDELAHFVVFIGVLSGFAFFGLRLLGQVENRVQLQDIKEGQRRIEDGIRDIKDGIRRIEDGLKENTAVLKEILDVLKSGKADGGSRSAAARAHEEPAE